jgi:type IV secretory pathway VirB10-like protein
MTQLSRPYQIALVAMALFVAVWFLALRGHTATSEPAPSAPAPTAPVAQQPPSSIEQPTTAAATTAAAQAAAKAAAARRAAAAAAHRAKVRAADRAAAKSRAAAKTASAEAGVEAELKRGKLVAILFWNPKGTVDAAVQGELAATARSLGGKLVVQQAGPGRVGAYGSITKDVQIDQTPTILLISKSGRTVVLTGLTDSYAIQQAIEELHA